jgi:hypothetical protein
MLPVPSGELSSITKMSAFGSIARIAGYKRPMFSRSLYVAKATNILWLKVEGLPDGIIDVGANDHPF